jgi:hypothetical protein
VMVDLFQIQDTRLHRLMAQIVSTVIEIVILTLDAAEEPALSLSIEPPKIKSVPQGH